MTTRTPRLLLLPLAGLLPSCAIYAPDRRADADADVPERFTLYSEEAPDRANRWWEHFESAELNALVNEAMTNSPSIQQAWARLAQAEAVAARIGADRLPGLDGEGSAGTTRRKTTTGANPGTDSFHSFTLGVNASYEVDLWGRIRSQAEAAALDREASREDLNAAATTLAAQVTLRWAGIVAQRLQTDVIHRQLDANRTSLELIELRFRKSLSTALDVLQQRQSVAAAEATIPLAELREELFVNELGALLGRAHLASLELADDELPAIGELPPLGVPADVLANRPDVRRAGLRLQAADWQVSAARADRLPAIRLTASARYSAAELADLFDNWLANLAASVTGPIFDAGRRKAEVLRTRAVVNERLAAYRETVINAVKEVEDALVSEQKQRDYIVALDKRLDAAREAYEEAVNRYRNGLIEYTTVLIQLNPLQALERDSVAARYDLLRYRIDLYRALGGAWTSDVEQP